MNNLVYKFPSHVKEEDVKEMFLIYKRNYRGKDDLDKYKMRLSFFFLLTMKPFVFGDLSLPMNVSETVTNDYLENDRRSWKSSQHSLQYWADTAQVEPKEVRKYFRSVDDFAPYT
tara:strand:- start:77 stop:421 length:345 start_codon:yes stop_codon:yes gene_type:complete